jgi:hypothetical protein
MSALVGYMFASGEGFKTLCPECASENTTYADARTTCPRRTNIATGTQLTPLFGVNLGNYQQHCAKCDVSINTHANPLFPELFDGK